MNDVRGSEPGFALAASFENSVVFDETRLLTPRACATATNAPSQGADVVGDLALAGLRCRAYLPCVAATSSITRC